MTEQIKPIVDEENIFIKAEFDNENGVYVLKLSEELIDDFLMSFGREKTSQIIGDAFVDCRIDNPEFVGQVERKTIRNLNPEHRTGLGRAVYFQPHFDGGIKIPAIVIGHGVTFGKVLYTIAIPTDGVIEGVEESNGLFSVYEDQLPDYGCLVNNLLHSELSNKTFSKIDNVDSCLIEAFNEEKLWDESGKFICINLQEKVDYECSCVNRITK